MNHTLFLAAAIAVAAPGVALVASAPGLAQQVSVPDGFQVVEGSRWSYAIPQDWQATQYPQPGIGNVTLVSQYESPDGQVFVNMVTEPFPGDVNTYLDLNLSNMQTFGFTVHNQTEAMVGSLVGAEVESSVPTQPPLRVLQRFTLVNETGYVLTCRTLESTFNDYRDRCSQILDTFRVSN